MSHSKAKLIGLLFRLNPALKRIVGERKYKQTKEAFEAHYSELDARIAREQGIMAFHRMFLITGLALHEALSGEFQRREALVDAIHDILWGGPVSKVIRLAAFFIRRSSDPFGRFLQLLGPSNEWFFPCPPWEKVSVEVQGGVGWHQTKCPHVEFFEREGVPELTRAYGDMDLRIAALLPDHIELKREHAMCRGDGWCDFLYYRKTAGLGRCESPAPPETPGLASPRGGQRAA